MGRHRRFVRSTLWELLRRVVFFSFFETQNTPVSFRTPASSGDRFSELPGSLSKRRQKIEFSIIFVMILSRSYSSSSSQASNASETQSDRLSSIRSIRSCSFRATEHWISDATMKSAFSRPSQIPSRIQVRRTKLLVSISPDYFRAGCALSEHKRASAASLRSAFFFIIFNIKKLFVMGDRFFCESFSETKSGKRDLFRAWGIPQS